ncbi:MAG: nitroreductase family protein, partial [Burkholderiales bacterium]
MTMSPSLQSPAYDAFDSLLTERFSCRGYLPDPVPRETIDEVLRLAQRTASWCNSQPWEVIVNSAAATERLRTALLAGSSDEPAGFDIQPPIDYRGVYKDRRRACGFQ